ncbi:hypothetical protein A2715_05375 [Candidatus Woesebacteria bacterium RIFCSPHIGHO2_01_FULL_39_32]|uniref:Uncharacterized protein n=1 Tax=Candidatus Woesebacteria bacterium RIFCSPLOWO2_01_FULL_39_25 TaxID=1802521 RepID=A0A1F8BLM3_9BACT|nr:MAG: hypothetical protein A2715_05375 [Candidatus Woesebacteria bacterium RIFCSPHIGHO2_01_FULL_39_32]OGM38553.1 MAG: hypothetical protein A3F01_04330 [Candidatus Woesebacteria bacterium RIFCSPHIGHO2_12_FULL_38_11]OGM64981.1 MAG: hypothetical protein A2893_04985 [Candidatus Woesebacteria bacterium RIFCSPLOWO2_01_FULL_39_25]
MDEVKSLFRKIVNGQSVLKQELLVEIKKVNSKVDGLEGRMKTGQNSIRKEMREGFKKVNSRLDKIGKSVAYLEDDAPTHEEHNKLEKRVIKVEKKLHLQAP